MLSLLLISNDSGLVAEIQERLESAGHVVTTIEPRLKTEGGVVQWIDAIADIPQAYFDCVVVDSGIPLPLDMGLLTQLRIPAICLFASEYELLRQFEDGCVWGIDRSSDVLAALSEGPFAIEQAAVWGRDFRFDAIRARVNIADAMWFRKFLADVPYQNAAASSIKLRTRRYA
jgi:hypothetical protein